MKYLVTSPTASYIPRPLYGHITVSMMADAHFGAADPIHHPQVLEQSTRFPWLVAIPRRPLSTSATFVMWQPFTRQDFVVISSSSVGLGTASPNFLERAQPPFSRLRRIANALIDGYGLHRELQWLLDTCTEAFDRLDFPSTFGDMARNWACVQRFWMYCTAWIDWHVVLNKHYPLDRIGHVGVPRQFYMGCFTTSTTLASRLAKMSVPVWFVRTVQEFSGNEIVMSCVPFTEPVTCLPFETPQLFEAHVTQFAGRLKTKCAAGDHHIDWINREAIRYLDREALPIPSNEVRSWELTSSASTSFHPSPSAATSGPPPSAPSTAGAAAPSGPSRTATTHDARYAPCKPINPKIRRCTNRPL